MDDYAHHPTEIAATLKAAQHSPHNSVWCVFQPHTYTRTKAFFHEFAEALSHADHLVLADIYAARETDTLGISSADLAREAASLGTDTHYFPDFGQIEEFLKRTAAPGTCSSPWGPATSSPWGRSFEIVLHTPVNARTPRLRELSTYFYT